MALNLPTIDMTALTPVQKMELADLLYDTAQQELDASPLTPEQLREIDSRLAAADGGAYAPVQWEMLYQQLQQAL